MREPYQLTPDGLRLALRLTPRAGRDGLDCVNCRRVLIEDAAIEGSDDALCFKSIKNGGLEHFPSRDVLVRRCRVLNGDDCITVKSGCANVLVERVSCEHSHGITVGSVWYDDVTNVTYRRVTMNRTHNGPMIKGRSQGNATVSGITFET